MNFQLYGIFSLLLFCTLWSAKANYYGRSQQRSPTRQATTLSPYYHSRTRSLQSGTRSTTVPVRNTPSVQAEMRSYRVESDIKFRYSRTKVISQFVNTDQSDRDQQAFLSVLLPEKAFISEFVMETGGKSYRANIERKDDAKDSYDMARIIPLEDGFLEMSKRESNIFSVNITLPAQEIATFHLTYEELLERKSGMYTYFVNIDPTQVVSVPNYEISVKIEDVHDLINLEATGINLTSVADSQPHVTTTANRAAIQWRPSPNVREKLKASKNAIDGRFKVHFDCDRGLNGEQLLISKGYFAHFIAPKNLPEMRKHVIFVLDVSAGMTNDKLRQLKQAQINILDELHPQDYFNIVVLNDRVHVWNPLHHPLSQVGPFPASSQFIDEAKDFIQSLVAEPNVYTNFFAGLLQALYLSSPSPSSQTQSNRGRANSNSPSYNNVNMQLPSNTQSLVMFVTAGNPTLVNNARKIILNDIRKHNEQRKVPIYTLAFGDNAKFIFLHKLATQNNGKARKVYKGEDSDVVSQIHGFFREEISKLLLTNIQAKYKSKDFEISEVTNTYFPTFFEGSEIVVAGRLTPKSHEACGHYGDFQAMIQATSTRGLVDKSLANGDIFNVGNACRGPSESWDPRRATADDKFLESLWAHLKIHQGIETFRVGGGRSLTQFRNSALDQAMQVALQYGFVTDITSLVVARPKSQGQSGTFRGKRSAIEQNQDPEPDYLESHENGENNVRVTNTHSSNATATPRSVTMDFDDIRQKQSTASLPPSTTTTTTPPSPSTTSTTVPPQLVPEPIQVDADYSIVELKDGFGKALTFPYIPSNVNLWSALSLEDSAPIYQISWLGDSVQTVRLSTKVYNVARNEKAVKRDDSNYYCTNSQNGGGGVCRHLKDCVIPEIANSLKTFKEYFCPITSNTHNVNNFAGVCCPFTNQVTPALRQPAIY